MGLKPANVAELKNGMSIVTDKGEATYIGVSSRHKGYQIIESSMGIELVAPHALFLPPLYWIEGDPVYKGDRLYWKRNGNPLTAKKFDGKYLIGEEPCYSGDRGMLPTSLTWEKPKLTVKKWLNIYPSGFIPYNTRKEADEQAAPGLIACVEVDWPV